MAKSRHGDLTARTKAKLLEEHAKEQNLKAQRMAMIDVQAQERKDGVVDLTDPNRDDDGVRAPESVDLTQEEIQRQAPAQNITAGQQPDVPVAPEPDEVQSQSVDVENPGLRLVEFRVNESVPQVTVGHGNTFDLVEGQKYKAPKYVYDHLEEKGLIYH